MASNHNGPSRQSAIGTSSDAHGCLLRARSHERGLQAVASSSLTRHADRCSRFPNSFPGLSTCTCCRRGSPCVALLAARSASHSSAWLAPDSAFRGHRARMAQERRLDRDAQRVGREPCLHPPQALRGTRPAHVLPSLAYQRRSICQSSYPHECPRTAIRRGAQPETAHCRFSSSILPLAWRRAGGLSGQQR